jgi:tRNA/tmRNA/rRNA uracil-C5-methylase (TrmA/RlmC/RlmD family)
VVLQNYFWRGFLLRLKDQVTIKIESIAFGGHGVGRVDNFVVFVPFAAPDDELEIEIVELKKKFARGRIVKISRPSPLRDVPLCSYYENCGGCCYQHLKYEQQLKIKKKQVHDAFSKIGKIVSPPVLEPIASPQAYSYRGKAQLHAANKASEWKLGFLDVSGGTIVDIKRCEIMEETINDKIKELRDNPKLLSLESNLTIWSGLPDDAPHSNDRIKRMVKGKEFLVPDGGFFQANLYLTDRLVDEVCRLAMPGKINTLVDAYCGSGLFSIFLSPYAQNVFGVETDEQAVKFAKRNAENQGVWNTKFICGEVENVLPQEFTPGSESIDLLVLDPPRSGCDGAVLKSISTLRPQKVIYISCNPATQARDIKYLRECGYDLLSLLPLDMFPQTEHIEVIGNLKLR